MLEIRAAGPLTVSSAHASVGPQAFPGRQGRLVFAYLAMHPRPVDSAELADVLWPDRVPASWSRDLSALVSKLRRLVGQVVEGEVVASGTGWYRLAVPHRVDLRAASRSVAAAEGGMADPDGGAALALVSEALGPLACPFLLGDDCAWVERVRERQRSDLARAWTVRARMLVRRADPGCVAAATVLADLDPLDEGAHVLLLEAHAAVGDRVGLLRAHERHRRLLREEVGLSPGARAEDLAAGARADRRPS